MSLMQAKQNGKRKGIAKWGFGMAPISDRMRHRYDSAVQCAKDLVEGTATLSEVQLDHISQLKGMFNRCLRQDQWDWFTVYSELGRPTKSQMGKVVQNLTRLRQACQEENETAVARIIDQLLQAGLVDAINVYQNNMTGHPPSNCLGSDKNEGVLYVLSTREQPDLLKIGMTRRSVEKRVKEINAATGVAIPFSVRSVFFVKDAPTAERMVFERLDLFRIRTDREFFSIRYRDAVKMIEECLDESGLRAYH